jgi:hypothetical protein
MKFRAEHDAEEPVDDLGVGETLALLGPLLGDVGMLGTRVRRYPQGCNGDAEKQQEARSM